MAKAKELKMNPRTKRKMIKINNQLEQYNQSTRLVELSTNHLQLNTGQILYNNDANRFIKRVMNDKIIEWVKNTDALLAGRINDSEIKHISFSIGGKACQIKHGEQIKANLNSGVPWNKNTKGQNIGKFKPRTENVKQKISEKNKGSKNGRYRYNYSSQERLNKSIAMQDLILNGKFTPKLNNRNTHWESSLDGKFYRSSWEALYKYSNNNAIYEELRLEYTFNEKNKIYIVDFIDHFNKLVIEVKPKELCNGNRFNAKMLALKLWAEKNLYQVLLVDQYWLKQQITDIDYTRFDEKTAHKIRKFYETNKTHRS